MLKSGRPGYKTNCIYHVHVVQYKGHVVLVATSTYKWREREGTDVTKVMKLLWRQISFKYMYMI